MLIVERQQRILDIIKDRQTVLLDDLARELDVSQSTARRDLESLEEQGLIERTHGGAVYTGEPKASGRSIVLAERMNQQVAQKQAIGQVAAELVKPHMTVLLDGGSTVIYAARLIVARPIQVVTTSLEIAGLFADDEQAEVLLVGGNVYPRTGVTIGPIATGTLADLHADLLLFSLAGIFGAEAFNVNMAMAEVEQVMMRQATRSVMLMDSGKFGRKSLARVCGLDEVDQIITDDHVAQHWRDELAAQLLVTGPEA